MAAPASGSGAAGPAGARALSLAGKGSAAEEQTAGRRHEVGEGGGAREVSSPGAAEERVSLGPGGPRRRAVR